MRSAFAKQTASMQAVLREVLDAYFSTTKFNFTRDTQITALRESMEIVYLRKRPLVCIDIEAFERNTSRVTEVGVAIYDPELQQLLMQPSIKTLHIIIRENKQLLNLRFVPNKKFEFNGGCSYELLMKQLRDFLAKLFNHYLVDCRGSLVGHNVDGDIKWIQSMGVKFKSPSVVDTMRIFGYSRSKGATLRGILRTMGIPHANLHNAANDAYYTLIASFALCDPQQRERFNLDNYLKVHPSNLSKKLQDAEKKRDKFLDKALLEQNTPLFEEFMASSLWFNSSIELSSTVYDRVAEEAESARRVAEKAAKKAALQAANSNGDGAPEPNGRIGRVTVVDREIISNERD